MCSPEAYIATRVLQTYTQYQADKGRARDINENAVAKAKNINTTARSAQGEMQGGMKVRVLGNDSNSFKFKLKNKK